MPTLDPNGWGCEHCGPYYCSNGWDGNCKCGGKFGYYPEVAEPATTTKNYKFTYVDRNNNVVLVDRTVTETTTIIGKGPNLYNAESRYDDYQS